MIGLGVGIDYALLIVTRYRSELAAGGDPAVRPSAADGHRRSLGRVRRHHRRHLAARHADDEPAVRPRRRLLGRRHRARRDARRADAAAGAARLRRPQHRPPARCRSAARPPSSADRGFWYRWSRTIQRRPVVTGLAGALALGVLIVPVSGLRLGFPDAGNDPTEPDHPSGLRPDDRRVRRRLQRHVRARRRSTATPRRWRRSTRSHDDARRRRRASPPSRRRSPARPATPPSSR